LQQDQSVGAPRNLSEIAGVLDALPLVSWIADKDGAVTYVSPGWELLTGIARARMYAEGYIAFVHPDDVARVIRIWETARREAAPYRDEVRVRCGDGSYRWVLSEARPLLEIGGGIAGWVGTISDIHARVQSDREREKFAALAEQSDDIIGISDREGRIVYANPAALTFLETTWEQLEGRHVTALVVAEDVAYLNSTILPAIAAQGRYSGNFRSRNFRTGLPLPVTVNAFAITDADGAFAGIATISRDRRQTQRLEIGMRALAEVGKAMLDSLDFETTLQNITDAIVRDFAHHCSVEIVAADGTIRGATLAARDASELRVAREAAATRNASLPPDHPIRRAIEHGESTLKDIAPGPYLESTGLDQYVGSRSGMLDISSVLYVPVRSPRDGRIYGSLSLGLDARDPRVRYNQDDVRFAQEIALRAGLAFDNASTYERTRRVAVEMQAASLPASLPQPASLQLHAEYRPAADEATIGGDWYDAFVLGDGRIVMTIGDVIGHGLKAAIWMTKLRQALQSAALLDAHPRVMLGVANRTAAMLEGDVYATALVAIFDPRTRDLMAASAGHPGPSVVRSDGTVEDVSCPGTMLGIPGASIYDVCTTALQPGDLVVFYTDGLVEAGRDFAAGQQRLRDALASESVRTAENPALALFEKALAGTVVQDDVAILTARVRL
jgi:PAS domain S-box-containing protein